MRHGPFLRRYNYCFVSVCTHGRIDFVREMDAAWPSEGVLTSNLDQLGAESALVAKRAGLSRRFGLIEAQALLKVQTSNKEILVSRM